MKKLKYITIFSLIMAISGLTPVTAADAGRTSYDVREQSSYSVVANPPAYRLTSGQMDKVAGGIAYGTPGGYKGTVINIRFDKDPPNAYCPNGLCQID